MKKLITILTLISLTLFSCKPGQKATRTTGNELKTPATLDGDWELIYITGPRIAFDGLYPDKKPTIKFDLQTMQVSGNSPCNSYGGTFTIDGQKITFGQMHSTLMACSGSGEATFMKMLREVESFSVTEEELTFSKAGIPVLKFRKMIQ